MPKKKINKDERKIIGDLFWTAIEESRKSSIPDEYFAYVTFHIASGFIYNFAGKKNYQEIVKEFLKKKKKEGK